MTRTLCFLVASVLAVTIASAEQYWIAYEGNDFPENEGWTRIWNGPLAERWIEDGALVVDARATPSTCEWYELYPGTIAPSDGELFVLEWRSKIEEFVGGWVGTTVSVYSDDCWAVSFVMNDNTIRSVYEEGVSAEFEQEEFHEFELRSFDMRTYELYIDGSVAIEGSFWESLFSNRIGWGESAPGSTCLSRWDSFRFGVVPEPSSGIGALALVASLLAMRARRQ